MARRPLIFGYLYEPHGSHPAGHLHRGGDHDPHDIDRLTALAQLAEDARFDFFAIGEGPDTDLSQSANPVFSTRTEPFTTASFLATKTKHIGLLAAANTSYYEPYNLARLTASLDHVTHGRAGWLVVTGATHPADRNYSGQPKSAGQHQARADEAVTVIRNLWDSWEDDAFIRDKETGAFVDGSKIHPINHDGEQFRVKGPLNVARPPQGQLPLAYETSSGASDQFAARHAELVFIRPHSLEEARQSRRRLDDAAEAAGRSRRDLRVLAEVTVVLAVTDVEARERLVALDRAAGVRTNGFVIAGTAETIANTLQEWAEADVVDGFLVRTAVLPADLAAFAGEVLPELQRRGIARTEYTAATLSGHAGLSAQPNRLVA